MPAKSRQIPLWKRPGLAIARFRRMPRADRDDLIYAARTRNGFTPKPRAGLMKAFRSLETEKCPFANLPEQHAGRWGVGLTAAKMADCRWLAPRLVGQFEFVEWTPDNHLRHSQFMGLREDKRAKDVRRE